MNITPLIVAPATAITGLALMRPSTASTGVRGAAASLKGLASAGRMAQLSGALLGSAFAVMAFRGLPLLPCVLLGALAGAAIAAAAQRHLHVVRTRKRIGSLDQALIALLDQIHLQLLNGKSLNAALTNAKGIANNDVASLQLLAKSGLDLESAVNFWIQDFDCNSKRLVGDLLLAKATTSETVSLTGGLIQQLSNEQRFALTAEIEKRNEMVWIPVTIAVLVPGMIFIAIPLEATLRTLLG